MKPKVKRPFWKKKRFYTLLIFIGFLCYTYWFLQLRLSADGFKARLKDAPYGYGKTVQSFNYKSPDGRNIRYTTIGNDSLPLIVFLHGSPASSFIWMDFLKDSLLLQHAHLIAVDRPGYGYSELGKPETSIRKQAEDIAPLLLREKRKHRALVLVGSSYGASVALRIAMDCPDCADALVLQSGSTKPGAETIYDISYPTSHWTLSWLVPSTLHTANLEKLSHAEELKKMLPLWQDVQIPVTILHGEQDKLIWPENAEFSKAQLTNSEKVKLVWVPGRGHDLTWYSRPLVCAETVELLQRVLAKKANSEVE